MIQRNDCVAPTAQLGWSVGASQITDDQSQQQIDAVMRASRVLVAVVARSLAEVEDVVTLPQFRVLVMIAGHGPQNLGSVAAALGVHPSNATRLCERLVVAGLVDRADDPQDRRFLRLVLTDEGHRLVETVMQHRRTAIAQVMARMSPSRRRAVSAALEAFATAAGEVPEVEESYLLGLEG
jgi:DNA-binding MarR family transcriptional regulator